MKNYFKKSLSLIMAVLMILSCWVWVAPEKAEAGAPDSYDVTVEYKVYDGSWGDDKPDKLIVEVWYIPDNGTGTETSDKATDRQEWTSGFPGEGSSSSVTNTVTGGWPSRVYIECNNSSRGAFAVEVTAIKINNTTVWSGSSKFEKSLFKGGYGMNWYPDTRTDASSDGSGGAIDTNRTNGTWSWPRPKLNAVTSTLTPSTHDLAKINSGTISKSTITLSDMYDDYGVKWTGTITPTFTLRVDDGITLGTNATMSGSGNSRTIEIKPWFQTLYEGKPNAKLYVDWTATGGTGSKSGTETINVNFPTYKATFDANGGKISDDGSEYFEKIERESEKMNYGSVIGNAPAFAEREGFEFKGFYSKDYDDAVGKTASFDENLKFKDGVTKILPEDYNQADADFKGDTTWYAAWQAKPITVTFISQDNQLIGTLDGRYANYLTAKNMYDGDAGLNAAVEASHTSGKVQFNAAHEPIYKNGSTTYKFIGWKIVKAYSVDKPKDDVMDKNEDTVLYGDVTFKAMYEPVSTEKYTVKFMDSNGETVLSTGKYNYRDEITVLPLPADVTVIPQNDTYYYQFIGWAKDIGKPYYAVDENGKDINGATIVYTDMDQASFLVKGNASYVPVFRMIKREYNVTFNYTLDNKVAADPVIVSGYHWDETVNMPEIKDNYTNDGHRYKISGWYIGEDKNNVKQLKDIAVKGNMTLTAVYEDLGPAEYTINFHVNKYINGKVEDVIINEGNNLYKHDEAVTAPEVDAEVNTPDTLYTFDGWKTSVVTPAAGDADYYANYIVKEYADVTFLNYDGSELSKIVGNTEKPEDRIFVGDLIPAYNGEAAPVRPETPKATYEFTGWNTERDGSGTTVNPGTDKFTGDIVLYAQYAETLKEYTVKFVNEGVTISEKIYHYGDEILVPANPTKASDVEYIYDFRAWSPEVSETCYADATYTATYRRTPQYYKVTWLNDAKRVHTESNYKYNAKIQQAIINTPVSYGDAGEGKTWAFKHWVQCNADGSDKLDKDGNQIIFQRGMTMGNEQLYFYPVFEAKANVLTVKFYKEDGTSYIGEAKIPYNGNIDDYDDSFKTLAPKLSTEDYHYIIDKWVNVNGGGDVSTITADVSVKATYTEAEHTKDVYDIIFYPTCTETGLADVSCSEEACERVFKNVVLDVIPDEATPAGQIIIGDSANKWTTDDYNASIDYNDIRYVSSSTTLIVNAWDYGTYSKHNLDAKLNRGVSKIDYYVSETVIDASKIGAWQNVYDFEAVEAQVLSQVLTEKGKTMQDYIAMSTPGNNDKKAIDDEVKAILASYNANATGIVSNLNLENGKTYIIYIRISDREVDGKSNVSYLSSGTISYGTKAAEITVTGDGYGSKFCEEASVRITDDAADLTITLDGEPVEAYTNPGTTSANGTFVASFKNSVRGVHTVTVIDKHGNKTVKTFEIKGEHTLRNYVVAATCTTAGSKYDLCTVCGAKVSEEAISAKGHSFTNNFVDKAATCTVNGSRTYVCDNNCGAKLSVTLDTAGELAYGTPGLVANTWNEEDKEWSNELTKADLAHLKADGEHTYAMVKDENGEDTDEFVWVIDKAPTCQTVGSRHRDCTVCGIDEARVTDDNYAAAEGEGHRLSAAKIIYPTCTTPGKKVRVCKYESCDYELFVEEIPATGHTAGEYRVITAATCEGKGSQILTCSECGTKENPVDIGEPVKDASGKVTGFNGQPIEIAAIGHSYKLTGGVYQDETDGKWYQNYVCRNDASHTKREEVEGYKPPVTATVTFKNGEAVVATITGNVGDTISAADITTKPTKAEDDTYTYTFSHWADTEGKAVKFPIEVKGDTTYNAVFAEKYKNYTITYYKDVEKLVNGQLTTELVEHKKTGYLHNNTEVKLADGPAKDETKLVKYVFVGWVDMNAEGEEEVVYTDNITINAANISLKAKYETVKKQYAVTYAYSSSDILETFLAKAGFAAKACDITPEKNSDSKYHYVFKEWNKASQLAYVESNIYTTPVFEAVSHDYVVTTKQAAACNTNRVDTYTCRDCGYTFDKEALNTMRAHKWSDEVKYDETTGKTTVTCIYGDCGVTVVDTRSFTAKFFVNADDADYIKVVNYIKWGATIDETKLPAAPTKAADATYTYTFKGWAKKGDSTETIIDFTKEQIKADVEYVAVFEGTKKLYTVTFAYDAYNTIKVITNVVAGSSVSFEGAIPTQDADVNYHYIFSGWDEYGIGTDPEKPQNITITNVQRDLYILANFAKFEHAYTNTINFPAATCTNGSGTRYYCDCNRNGKFDDKVNGDYVDYYYDETTKPLDHNFELKDTVPATPEKDGYEKYVCAVCGKDKTEPLKYQDNKITVQVTITHNGVAEKGVKVEIRPDGLAPVFATTNANGIATAEGTTEIKNYIAYATINGEQVQVTLTKDNKGNWVGAYNYNDAAVDCSCACHRDNIWGAIFRFFHKIIKLFTGEFKCCGNPDPMYG